MRLDSILLEDILLIYLGKLLSLRLQVVNIFTIITNIAVILLRLLQTFPLVAVITLWLKVTIEVYCELIQCLLGLIILGY